jgi:hypothetical protein
MAVAENELQAIPLGIQLDQLNTGIDHGRHPAQPKRPTLRARALAPQFGVIQPLFTAIGPVQSQLLFAPGITDGQRVHCS